MVAPEGGGRGEGWGRARDADSLCRCVLPEDKLGKLLTPIKQRGLRALVTAALTDRRLALDLRTSVGM